MCVFFIFFILMRSEYIRHVGLKWLAPPLLYLFFWWIAAEDTLGCYNTRLAQLLQNFCIFFSGWVATYRLLLLVCLPRWVVVTRLRCFSCIVFWVDGHRLLLLFFCLPRILGLPSLAGAACSKIFVLNFCSVRYNVLSLLVTCTEVVMPFFFLLLLLHVLARPAVP